MRFSTFEVNIIEKHYVFQHSNSKTSTKSLTFSTFELAGRGGTRPGRVRDAPGRVRDASPGRTGTRRGASGTRPGRPGRAGANGGEEEQDICAPPALATPESHPALTQLRVAITSRTRNTISRLGGRPSRSHSPNLQCRQEAVSRQSKTNYIEHGIRCLVKSPK